MMNDNYNILIKNMFTILSNYTFKRYFEHK